MQRGLPRAHTHNHRHTHMHTHTHRHTHMHTHRYTYIQQAHATLHTTTHKHMYRTPIIPLTPPASAARSGIACSWVYPVNLARLPPSPAALQHLTLPERDNFTHMCLFDFVCAYAFVLCCTFGSLCHMYIGFQLHSRHFPSLSHPFHWCIWLDIYTKLHQHSRAQIVTERSPPCALFANPGRTKSI